MDLEPKGCLFPNSEASELRVQECTPEKCKLHTLYSVVSAQCPLDYNSSTTPNPNSSSTSLSSVKLVRTRCMVNRTTEVFYWLPPVEDCFSAQSEEAPPFFYGSIYTLRQLQQAFQAGKAAAVAVREKPLVSLSVGMSALSIVLVLIMLLGVCHRNVPDVGTSGGSSGSTAAQRQRQAAARRRARARSRRRENDNRNSIGTQADVAEPSDRLFILLRQEFTRRAETPLWFAIPLTGCTLTSIESMTSDFPDEHGGVNAGFNDSEALLAQPQEVAGHTPVVLSVTHEGDLALPDHDDPVRTDSIGQDGRGGSMITTDCENELSRLSCLAVPHVDIPPVEYQPPPPQPALLIYSIKPMAARMTPLTAYYSSFTLSWPGHPVIWTERPKSLVSPRRVKYGSKGSEAMWEPRPPKVLKGSPMLPSYEDATKRGMYCIIRPTDISAPPAYQLRLPEHVDDDSINGDGDAECDMHGAGDSNPLSTNVFPPISSWDFETYGVHRGSVNSMPEFSRLYGPPESPYPGDVFISFTTMIFLSTVKS
ncbi:hypothetical protein ACTXT7_010779 [Hymenolepis weldensis]